LSGQCQWFKLASKAKLVVKGRMDKRGSRGKFRRKSDEYQGKMGLG